MITIPPVPTPVPSSASPDDFDALADAMLGWFPGGVAAMNDQNEENNTLHEEIHDKVDEAMAAGLANAATNAATATTKAADAEIARAAAVAAQGGAEAAEAQALVYRDEAQEAAENAADAADIPDITGHAGEVLRVKQDGSGKEWFPAGLLTPTSRASNVALGALDIGKLIIATAGFTQTIADAGTLGPGWWLNYQNASTARVVLDPFGAQTINGAPTFVLLPGEQAVIACTGTAFIALVQSTRERLRPIFDAETASLQPVSDYNSIENTIVLPYGGTISPSALVLASNGTRIIAGCGSASASIPTTTDGRTWVLRAAPSSANWIPCSDGSGFMIFGAATATTTGYSPDGAGSFTAATALPGAASGNVVAAIPGRYLRKSGTASTLYLTTNNGSSWSTETAPNTSVNLYSCGGLFVAHQSGTTYYTSATGATGSWTSRTLPASASGIVQQPDGSLIASGTGNALWRTTDGINWTDLAVAAPATGGALLINGVLLHFTASPANTAYTLHGGRWMARRITNAAAPTAASCARLGLIHVLGPGSTGPASGAGAYLIDPTAADAALALFAA